MQLPPYLVLALCLLPVAAPVRAQGSGPLAVLDTARLASPRLTEASGVAASAIRPGVYWTHNDSGDGPYLYATDSAGRDLGAVRVVGAAATDWEDLAAGPCVVAPGRCLYVADIGDNARRRTHVTVYRLREPAPPRGRADTLGVVPLLDSIALRYPDRPHDAEALVVDPGGRLLLITKDRVGPAVLYVADARPGPSPRLLRRVGELPIETSLLTGRLVTGAALDAADSLLVVRTYVSLHLFRLAGESLEPVSGGRRGWTIPIVEPQGEGVTFDGPRRLVLVSERGEAPRGLLVRLALTWPPVGRQAPPGPLARPARRT